jgi:hypothetical protein
MQRWAQKSRKIPVLKTSITSPYSMVLCTEIKVNSTQNSRQLYNIYWIRTVVWIRIACTEIEVCTMLSVQHTKILSLFGSKFEVGGMISKEVLSCEKRYKWSLLCI